MTRHPHRVASVWIASGLLFAGAALVNIPSGAAHERHRSATGSHSDSMHAEPSMERGTVAQGAPEKPFAMPPMPEAFLHHLHNKIVHLPIVLAPVALALLLVERKRPGTGAAAPWLIRAAALAGWVAYFAGRAQAGAFEDGPKEWLVAVHQLWGTAAAIALTASAALASWAPARRHLWIAGAVATAAVLGAAFYGGLVAHG